jgi:membrane protein
MRLVRHAWSLLKDAVKGFIAHGDISRGAAIAYFTLFAVVPVLVLVIAVAGAVFGHEAAQGAIVAELSGLMGAKTADALQEMLAAANRSRASEGFAAWAGVGAILFAASGIFGEVQTSLNKVWQVKDESSGWGELLRVRLISLTLVLTLGFLLIVSLAVSAGLAAFAKYLLASFPVLAVVIHLVELAISALLMTALFAAIYKFLPDTPIAWRDVAVGALFTTGLFALGRYLIALYVTQTDVASTFGAAGAVIVMLVWIFFAAQFFLLGAEFTRAWAEQFGSHKEGRRQLDETTARPDGRAARE